MTITHQIASSIPVISLHDHLDGSIRPETLLDLARQSGIELPAHTPQDLQRWATPTAPSLAHYLRPFGLIADVLQSEHALERLACEYAQTAIAEGLAYAEVRWAPIQHTRQGVTMEQAVSAVSRGLAQGLDGSPVRINQILCLLRGELGSMDTARLALKWRENGVVGVDLAGDEAAHGLAPHLDAFALLARELMPVTIHAGEAAGLESVSDALVDGHALRLGHGVRVIDDIDEGDHLGRVAQWVRDRRIALEMCPTSNIQTGAIVGGTSVADHPIDRLVHLGFTVTISPDNRFISGATARSDLELTANTFDWDVHTVQSVVLNAAHSAFLSLPQRLALQTEVTSGFAASISSDDMTSEN